VYFHAIPFEEFILERACEPIKTTHPGNKIMDHQISSLSVKDGIRKQQTSEFYKPAVLCTICTASHCWSFQVFY